MLYNLIPLQEATQSNPYTGIIIIVVLIGIFYFFMIRPQQKRQKEIRKFREGIKNGDNVITAGGIYGRVREIKDNLFVIEIASGVKISVDKGSVYPSANDANIAAQENQNK